MMPGSPDIDAFSRALGSLESSVQATTATVASMTKAWADQEHNASVGRRVIHDKLDEVKRDLTLLTGRVNTMGDRLAEISPAIEEFKNQRQRQIGARSFGKYLWSAMLGAAGAVGWLIHEWLTMGAPKGH